MIEKYQDFYNNDDVFCKIQEAFEVEMLKLYEYYDEYINQLFVSSADYSISRWEKLYGLGEKTGAELFERREIVLAKMQVYTATLERIKALAAMFTSGMINITNDSRNYTITVEFIDEYGAPTYIEDFKKIFEETIPAHYHIEYVYIYRTWGEVAGYTWDGASGYTWEEFRSLEEIET